MGLSNMLSKLFKKENTDISTRIPLKFKDFDSIIVPPEPKTRSVFVYQTLDLGMDFTTDNIRGNFQPAADKGEKKDNAVLLTDDIVEEIN